MPTMPVIRDSEQQRFSRSDLVRFVASKDGGAHVDSSLPDPYFRVSRGHTHGWTFQNENGDSVEDTAGAVQRRRGVHGVCEPDRLDGGAVLGEVNCSVSLPST